MTEIADNDAEQAIVAQVNAARAAGTALAIHGGRTKAFYGNPTSAQAPLDCSVHRGVLAYEPTELALTVRAGTSLAAVEARLAEHGQELPFEPPHFGEGATIGGMVAAGLSGPRRPYSASVRDAVLGVRMLNGQGEVMDFGGRVMKNVAGYDLSRLMVGSLGVLGVLLEVSMKVLPMAPARLTLRLEQDAASALRSMATWARQALPITATAWLDGRLYVRLSGSDEALTQTQRIIGGEPFAEADAFWAALREQQLAFFTADGPLWRLSVSAAAPAEAVAGAQVIEWGGALRWLRPARDGGPESIRRLASAAGGHATLFRTGALAPPADGVFAPLDPVVLRLHRNLKRAFDPARLFNPGRLYPPMDEVTI